ncbi:hypothetical protein DFH07DRAFT_965399 [Mycena maculata]|uniref:Uncharacterized protein n=1 Tax=Mycena maculata TaxID=230809 RepID=A0AAD7ICY3_9AGAR|nr:hypothetical protein DFH07DRAFT_965399 [Mycena maculata]
MLGEEHFPLLESLKLSSPYGFHQETTASWNRVKIVHIPAFRHISLDFAVNPLGYALPWTRLTELNIVAAAELNIAGHAGLSRNAALQIPNQFSGGPSSAVRAARDPARVSGSRPRLHLWDPTLPTEGHYGNITGLLDDAFLRRLTTVAPDVNGPHDLGVLDFIQRKAAAHCPIRVLNLEFGFRLKKWDLLRDLQPFIRRGLRINLRYPPLPKWQYSARAGLQVAY